MSVVLCVKVIPKANKNLVSLFGEGFGLRNPHVYDECLSVTLEYICKDMELHGNQSQNQLSNIVPTYLDNSKLEGKNNNPQYLALYKEYKIML